MKPAEPQRTIAEAVTVSGKGLHSGEHVAVRLLPAGPSSGIAFHRTDRSGSPPIHASLDEVVATERSVVLGQGLRVATVEHLLSAARGLGVDNLVVELDGEELPCGDGSASVYVEALLRAGFLEQGARRRPIALGSTVWAESGSSIVAAIPSGEFRVTYVATVDGTALAPQIAQFCPDADDYASQIAPARTWGRASDADSLRAKGFALGASLATALVIGPEGFVNEPRFPNEMARHKILDIMGDLALLGQPLLAHIVAVRGGHALHIALAREIAQRFGGADDA